MSKPSPVPKQPNR